MKRFFAGRNKTRARLVIFLVPAVALVFGLFQIDLVHQNAEIFWITITGQTWHLHGRRQVVKVYSPALGQTRQVIVYTPPDYDAPENAGLKYPVLYLLHGSPDPGDGWDRYGRAPEEADRLNVLYNYPPLIVVCPDGNGEGQLGDSEYIDAPNPKLPPGSGKDVATFITRDLVQWVDSHYRTVQTPRGRILGGISTGGYGAMNLGLQHPELFATLFSFSGYYRADPAGWARPVWGHPSQAELTAQSPLDYVTGPQPRWADMFVVIGDGLSDRSYYRTETAEFAQRLQAAHIPYVYRSLPGRHSWDLWRSLLRGALRSARSRLPNPGN